MSANKEETLPATTAKSGKTEIEVTVDSEQMKRLLEDLKKKEDEAEELTKKLKDAQEAKTTAEKTLEDKTTEAEDYRTKLTLITEQKLNAKRKVILDKAKELITDEDRLKKIEEGMKDAKGVKATEFMIDTLAKTLEEGRKQHEALQAKEKLDNTRKALIEKFPDAKDKIEGAEDIEALENLKKELTPEEGAGTGEGTGTGAPAEPVGKGGAGTIPLTRATTGVEGYDSHQAMVQDLRRMEHSDNPEEAAYAKAVLDELFRKWGVAVKKRYEGKSGGLDIGEGTTEGLKQPKIKELLKQKRR